MRYLWGLLSLILIASPAFAQGDRGTITGTVSDPAGAVVANAPIEAKNVETGAVYPTQSTTTGNYTLAQLPAGTYELSVSVPGFKKFIRQGLEVQVAQVLRIDMKLDVGATTESITVNAEASLLKTENGELSHNVAISSLDNLPVLGIGTQAAGSYGIRNPAAVAQVIPGTFYVGNTTMVVNGAPANTATYRVEGMDSTNQIIAFAAQQSQPPIDAVQEVSVQTSNFAPEYGTVGGGFFNFTMKSGTNQLHGSVYENYVNEAFNASQPFINQLTRARRNDYGFTIGGPVWLPKIYDGRNKTFFFVNWEQYREVFQVFGANIAGNINQFLTVPTTAYRQGDFSGAILAAGNGKAVQLTTDPATGAPVYANQIFDPASEHIVSVNGNSYLTRSPFPDNMIPLNRMDPVALKVQALIPSPQGPNASQSINNWLQGYPNDRLSTVPSFKIDQIVGSKGKLSFYWSNTMTTAQYTLTNGNSDGLPLPLTEARGSFIYVPSERLNYDYTITPTLLLHLGAGYWRNSFADKSPVLNYNAEESLGLRGATINRNFPVFSGLTQGSAGGMNSMGPPGQTQSYEEKPTFNASLTWVKDNHTYKIGGEFRTDGYPTIPYTGTNGNYQFATNQTGLPSLQGQTFSKGNPGFPYASFLLGLVNQVQIAAPSETRQGKSQTALFLQDSWKVNRKLTMDYGVRWDYGTYLREQYGRGADFSPITANPSAGGRLGGIIFEGDGAGHCNCDFAHNYPYAIGPRIGVAYQITPKTVFRAGWGLVYGQTPEPGGAPSSASATITSPAFDEPAMTLAQGIPQSYIPVWPVFDPGLYPVAGTLGPTPTYLDPNSGRPPRQNQWSIGLQREITGNLVVEGSYVGNRGVWWTGANVGTPLNFVTPDILRAHGLDITNPNDQKLLSSTLSSTLAVQRGFNNPPYAGFPLSSTVLQSLMPYPQFSTLSPATGVAALIPASSPSGKTWYDSLQAKVTKRYSHGLSLTGTFTWAKSLMQMTSYNDAFNRDLNKTYSNYDQPFIFTLSATYQVPKFNINKAASWALRDWTIGAFFQRSSGMPIPNPGTSNSPSMQSLLGRTTLANRNPGVPLYTVDLNCQCIDPNKQFVLNPAAWSNPAPGQWGTGSEFYGDYRYERRPIDNMNLGRTIRIKERYSLNVRMEFQNIFNRTYLPNPVATGFASVQTRNSLGVPTGGFGYINSGGSPGNPFGPRSGLIVARLQF